MFLFHGDSFQQKIALGVDKNPWSFVQHWSVTSRSIDLGASQSHNASREGRLSAVIESPSYKPNTSQWVIEPQAHPQGFSSLSVHVASKVMRNLPWFILVMVMSGTKNCHQNKGKEVRKGGSIVGKNIMYKSDKSFEIIRCSTPHLVARLLVKIVMRCLFACL